MTTIEEAFQEFQKIPDWDRYPMPEVFYEHFKVKKPRPEEAINLITYTPPPYQSLNEKGKVEIRGPAPGGVREIKEFLSLPVEVKRHNEETDELEDYPPPNKYNLHLLPDGTNVIPELENWIEKLKAQIADGKPLDFDRNLLNLPKEHNN